MSTNYYRRESWVDNTFSKRGKFVLVLLAVVFFVGIVTGGCGFLQNLGGNKNTPEVAPVNNTVNPAPSVSSSEPKSIDIEEDSKMVSYDVTTIGRSDPFMPMDEILAFDEAKKSAFLEAEAYNARVLELKKKQGTVITEKDDINPYSFTLPTPPTSLASSSSDAAKITRTKVVGIMYNKVSPSAIINVDDKDYLVRQGDQIIGQEYKVVQINPSYITVNLGANIYSAGIGELFSREDFNKTQNDLYDLKNRFGGRKS